MRARFHGMWQRFGLHGSRLIAVAKARPSAGIRARLFLAFAAVAASLLFSQIGGLLRAVAEHNIPEVVATLELASHSETLRAIAPASSAPSKSNC